MEAAALVVGHRGARTAHLVDESGGPAVRILCGVAALGLGAYAAHSILGFGGNASDGLFENWVFNGLLFASAALCLLRAARSPTDRGAWTSLGVGLGCWALGEVLFTLDPSQVTEGTFPATSDFLWLVFYPAAFLTLGLLVRARVRHFYPSLWLDGIIGALAVGALASQFVLPTIIGSTGGSLSSVVGDLVYPLGDLLLISFVVAVLALTGWRPGRVLGMVAVGLALGAVADTLSLYNSATGQSGSSMFDALWPASALVLGWAAWQSPRAPQPIVLQGRRLLAFPWAFAVVAIGLLALQHFHSLHSIAYVLAVLTIAGVIIRMSLTFSENLALVDRSTKEALTDTLTGLGNRRRLLLDLEEVLHSAAAPSPRALLLLDLNGFKRYNDTFGHPRGDSLLLRLGGKLAEAVAPEGQTYRLGGDEFCVLTTLEQRSVKDISEAAVAALSEKGAGFEVSTSCGSVMLPEEAHETAMALQLVDKRLYVDKRSRDLNDVPDQLRDVLLQVMAEREPDLHEHLSEVALLARNVARGMGLRGEDLEILVRAAELHDLGKVAVPESILQKPAALDPLEREIIERHSEVGERILATSPAMAPVAEIVRASHETYDGRGYPDRRAGEEIPVGARIISVCDAFHAMTSDRPYSAGKDVSEAITELRRVAGTQFDPEVVEVFCTTLEDGGVPTARLTTMREPTVELA